jgi:hypothetical protein
MTQRLKPEKKSGQIWDFQNNVVPLSTVKNTKNIK